MKLYLLIGEEFTELPCRKERTVNLHDDILIVTNKCTSCSHPIIADIITVVYEMKVPSLFAS